MAEPSDADLRHIVNQRKTTVANLLNSNKFKDALTEALRSPPSAAKDQTIKDENSQIVVNVLTSIKEADVKKRSEELTNDQLDQVMKFVYKGFEFGENCAVLLKWHEVLLETGGGGCIIRALADKKST
eukprot:TRINITY_DN5_c0_g1_i1.p1 TRINITY_DN5_c0_g1~~TRINITY_DN5_c0_g1_i1.p1  ORF type:complete len:144 (+),score=62.94 TRINITY_DN5_c0_g1_i1:50-433(+)